MRKRTKEFMTSLINGALQRRQVVFPIEELEIEEQANLDQVGEETVSLVPVMTDPVFV